MVKLRDSSMSGSCHISQRKLFYWMWVRCALEKVVEAIYKCIPSSKLFPLVKGTATLPLMKRYLHNTFYQVEWQSSTAPGIGSVDPIFRQRTLSSEIGFLLVKQVVRHILICALQNKDSRERQVHVVQNESFAVTGLWQTKLSQFPFSRTFQNLECVPYVVNPQEFIESVAFPELPWAGYPVLQVISQS